MGSYQRDYIEVGKDEILNPNTNISYVGERRDWIEDLKKQFKKRAVRGKE